MALLGWLNRPGIDSSPKDASKEALEQENRDLRNKIIRLEQEIEFLKRPNQRCDAETQTSPSEKQPSKEKQPKIYTLEIPNVPEKYKKTKFHFGTSKVFETKMIVTGDSMRDFQLLNYVTPKNAFQKYLIPANPASMKKHIRRALAEEPVLDFTGYSVEVRPATMGGYHIGIYQKDLVERSWKKSANGYAVINDRIIRVVSSVGVLITEVEISTNNIRMVKDKQGINCIGGLDGRLAIFFLKFKDKDSFARFSDKTRQMMSKPTSSF